MGWKNLGGRLCFWQRGHIHYSSLFRASKHSLSFISVPVVTSLHPIHLQQPRSDLTRNPFLSPSIWISAIVFNQFHHHQCLDSIKGGILYHTWLHYPLKHVFKAVILPFHWSYTETETSDREAQWLWQWHHVHYNNIFDVCDLIAIILHLHPISCKFCRGCHIF